MAGSHRQWVEYWSFQYTRVFPGQGIVASNSQLRIMPPPSSSGRGINDGETAVCAG